MPSEYQNALFQSLHEIDNVDLEIVFAHTLSDERKALGWDVSLDLSYRFQFLGDTNRALQVMKIAWQQRNRIHIVGGLWAVKPFLFALIILRWVAPHYFVYSEAPNPTYKRSRLIPLYRQAIGTLFARTSRAGLLCISHFSRNFHSALGFAPNRIYDFGYFGSTNSIRASSQGDVINLVYVGQLIQRKRVDLLINALAPYLSKRVHLTLIGSGNEMDALKALVASHQAQDHVTFTGAQPFEKVIEHLSQSSALVLPSDYDGWGMVVNEALMVGIPVIVSDGCGAADVIVDGHNGFVFERSNLASLKVTITRFLDADQVELRRQAAITGEQLSVENASQYLIACIQHKIGKLDTKPVPPWQGTYRLETGKEELAR